MVLVYETDTKRSQHNRKASRVVLNTWQGWANNIRINYEIWEKKSLRDGQNLQNDKLEDLYFRPKLKINK